MGRQVGQAVSVIWNFIESELWGGDGCSPRYSNIQLREQCNYLGMEYIFRSPAIWVFVLRDFSEIGGFVISTDIWEVPSWKCVYPVQSKRVWFSFWASFKTLHRFVYSIQWSLMEAESLVVAFSVPILTCPYNQVSLFGPCTLLLL